MSIRRLPVYILLDCSESMIGESIEAVQQGVDMLLKQLRSDPHALETAYVSIITYHATAQQVVPLTELTEVSTPELTVRPGTSLGAALKLLRTCINREVRKTTADQKADYRPIVFLLTDGQPTDGARELVQEIRQMTTPKIANLYAIGCGIDVDFESLHEVADAVFKLEDMTPQTLKKLFIWLTASVQGASTGAGAGAGDVLDGLDLSKKPAEVEEVAPGSEPSYHGEPRQVFLKVYCSDVRRPYLMRYRLAPEYGGYIPITSHKMESRLDEGKGFTLPPINVSNLLGCPPCPYCPNEAAGACGCGALLCVPSTPTARVMCPSCLNHVTLSDSGGHDFEINQSAG